MECWHPTAIKNLFDGDRLSIHGDVQHNVAKAHHEEAEEELHDVMGRSHKE